MVMHALTVMGARYAEEYARQKMERLCAAAVELQSALEGVPMKAGYNMHVETLAIAAKTATNLARQVEHCLPGWQIARPRS